MTLIYMSQENEYRRFSIYNAELKKPKGYTIRKKDFKSDEEMDSYIMKARQAQKLKNKLYRDELTKNKQLSLIAINNNGSTSQDIIKIPEQMDNINNFKLDKNTGNTTFIFGSSKTGKTTLMMSLYEMFYEKDKDLISTLFAGNAQIDKYKGFKSLLVGDGFNNKSEKYIKMQKYINMKTDNKYKFLNMFDDIIHTKYSQLVNNLVMTYRNSNISTIMLLQYGKLLNKANRANANNIIIFRSHNNETIKDMIDLFLKDKFIRMGLYTPNDMLKYYNEVTDNYGFFYIHNGSNQSFSTHRLKI